MDVDESDNDISDNGESDSDNEGEHSSSEDSEEGSDDENEDGTKPLSDEEDDGEDMSDDENEDGTKPLSDGEDVSDDENEDGTKPLSDEEDDGEDASDDDGTIGSDDEEVLDKGDLPVSTLDDPDASCPICLNEFVGQDLGSPENCNHTFCLDCIVEWSKNVNTCPIDRIEFHLIYMKQEISGDVIKKIKVKVKKEVEEYVEEVTLCEVCRLGDREDRLLLCDSCDSGYHCECLDPPLETIPIEEWFCPPCARVINRRAAGSHSSHSRLIARTSASEIVRSRIQNHRAANSEDSGAEAVQQPHSVPATRRSPQKRRVTKRKTKRKTTRKSSKSKTTKARTKATSTSGKAKAKKSTGKRPTKRRRKTKRRKTRKTKKKSRRSWLASMKLVAPSVKKRIADHLGLCKPPPGHTMPYIKKSGGQHSIFVEQAPALDMFGSRDKLLDFGESYFEDDLDISRPTFKHISKPSYSRKPIAVASTSGINLLDNILENQSVLLQSSKNITIGKDGSLNRKENLGDKVKCGTKSSKSETKNEASVHVKEERNVVPLSSSFRTGAKGTSAAQSLVNVKREKRSPSPDSPVCAKSIKLDDTLSPFPVKDEKKRLKSHVKFSDVETNFTVKDSMNSSMLVQSAGTGLLSAPVEKEGYLPCTSSFRSETEGIPSSKPAVYIKKEKDYLLFNSLVDMKNVQTKNVYENGSNKISVSCNQNLHLKDRTVSSSSILNTTEKHAFYDAVDNSDLNSNELSFPCSLTDSISIKGNLPSESHSQRSSKPVCTKTEKCSVSLYDKAQSDRKRHLPFLSNGVNRPFKIPKLVKRVDESSVSKANLLSSEISGKHLDTKVHIKTENVIENNMSPEPVLSNGSCLQGDLKFQNMREEHTLTECMSSLAEAVDIDMHADLKEKVQSVKGNNSSLHVFKREKVNAPMRKPDKHSENSLLSVPNSWDDHAAHNKGNSECTLNGFLGFQKQKSQVSSVSLNSNHKHSDKSHGCLPSISSKTTSAENNKQKHLLDLDCVEQWQNHIAADKPGVQIDKEHTAPNKTTDKVVSKHDLKDKIAAEIKKHLKDFYVTDLITKEEYKEIMRRSVPKVLQNCGNSIDSEKIRKLVVSYVHLIGNTKSECS